MADDKSNGKNKTPEFDNLLDKLLGKKTSRIIRLTRKQMIPLRQENNASIPSLLGQRSSLNFARTSSQIITFPNGVVETQKRVMQLRGVFDTQLYEPSIDDIEYWLELDAQALKESAIPVMSIYELCIMLLPPIYSDEYREKLSKGILSAIEDWGMMVVAYPDILEHPAFFKRLPDNEKQKTRIHIDLLEKFSLAGKVTPDAPSLVSLWRKYIASHENKIIIPQLENIPKIGKIKPRKKMAKNRHAEWLNRAIWLWNNWEQYENKHRLDRV